MSETQLDGKYAEGVWYDTTFEDLCQIRDLGYTVGLFESTVSPEESEPYYTFDEGGVQKEEAIDMIHQNFSRVSPETVESPTRTVQKAVDMLDRNSMDDLRSMSFQEAIDLRFARKQVEIREQSETELLSDFYEDVRESARTAMVAEGVDRSTRQNILETMDITSDEQSNTLI